VAYQHRYAVEAVHVRDATHYDLVSIETGLLDVGSHAITSSCNSLESVCTLIRYYINIASTGGGPEKTCVAESGTVAITEITEDRAKGTFSGTLYCGATTMTVTGGSFNVPIHDAFPIT
jgi:hypothetical protein